MELPPDFADLLVAFRQEDVRYMVIGGYAVSFHSRPRFTKDIDLWIGADADNRQRAADALAAFGAPRAVVESLRDAAPEEVVWMGTPPLRVDVLQEIDGVDFETAWSQRVETSWGATPVTVASVATLLDNKRAAGRPKDLLDVRALEEVAERKV